MGPKRVNPKLKRRVNAPKGCGAVHLGRLLVPSAKEMEPLLAKLHKQFGLSYLSALVSVSPGALSRWLNGSQPPSPVSCRVIWLTYCMVFEPKRVATLFHIATWGKFADDRECSPAVEPKANTTLT
jgi:hypothetical protein